MTNGPAPESPGRATPKTGSVVMLVHRPAHGPAPLVSNVTVVGQAWNWALKTLANKGLADKVSQVTYHVDFKPNGSKLKLKNGPDQVGDVADVGTALDDEAWTRGAFKLAITLVNDITQQHGVDWKPTRDILAKAL